MKPAARIKACQDILESAHRSRVPLDKCVGDYIRVRRYIGSKDRSAVAERIYNMTRAHARIGWWLEKLNAGDTPRNRLIIWLAAAEKADEKYLKDLFDGSQYAPDTLTQEELILTSKVIGQPLEPDDMPLPVRVECPPGLEKRLKEIFGAEFENEMRAMLEPATLDLRVNTYTANKEKVIKYLEADGVKVREGALCPWALRCEGKAYLSKTKAFNKGWIEIQDEGSQMIAYLCDAQPTLQILDYCAGAGGKTLALAAAMQRKGRIVAADNDARRLENGRKRYKKAGIADIVEVRCLAEDQHRKWIKRQKEKFDIVLVDAPCSGTGTWRRNPDMRWQTYGPPVEDLVTLQKEILDKAARCVRPGGRLVYATCSLLPEENEEQVAQFLREHGDFKVIPVDSSLNIGNPYMRLTPFRHGTDGFFAAILERNQE